MNIYDLLIIRRQLRYLNLDYSALQDVGDICISLIGVTRIFDVGRGPLNVKLKGTVKEK